MKKVKGYQLVVFFFWILSSCKTVLIPNYTNVDYLSKLNPGMSKIEVLQTLNKVYPYDILNGEKDGCEVHHYKYKHPNQNVIAEKMDKRSGLRGGEEKYLKEGDAYLVYKNGLLYSAITLEGSDFAPLIAIIEEANNTCSNIIKKGCMDPESLNYDSEAVESDGSCNYCNCGYSRNPEFNPNRPQSDCNSPCIKIMDQFNQLSDKKTCGTCELIEVLKNSPANVNVNIDFNSLEKTQPEIKAEPRKKLNTKSKASD